ncbi:hypothetical protein K435DRAFT_784777 [Dendrothele bispora CBS 962.96]|uniref:Uncharacterized protein n=1 Tax=Dendrothele bispora (strain CBS 962.96) TaxID=1314807 RepID=A0A4S8L1Z6_DENBC|nr:hypothetical protein K435DRAFT_784777 [Dendrothele bispora CBS 962.96]
MSARLNVQPVRYFSLRLTRGCCGYCLGRRIHKVSAHWHCIAQELTPKIKSQERRYK